MTQGETYGEIFLRNLPMYFTCKATRVRCLFITLQLLIKQRHNLKLTYLGWWEIISYWTYLNSFSLLAGFRFPNCVILIALLYGIGVLSNETESSLT